MRAADRAYPHGMPVKRKQLSTIQIIDEINNEILTGQLYKALRAAKKLIQHEQDILSNAAARDAGLPDGGQADR